MSDAKSMTEFDLSKLPPANRYNLLISLVVPRPIALVTSIDKQGVVNAAPFSFFNLMGNDPPIVALGVGKDESRRNGLKDTGYNIQQTGEFVINIVNEKIVNEVNTTSIDFPPDVDEAEIAGLTKIPSVKIRPPRIAESAANLECRHINTIEIRNTRIILGEIIYIHLKNEFIEFKENNFRILTELIKPIGRAHGRDFYTRTIDLFKVPRMSYKEWIDSR
jgi:flavin reductase (DIM6/NTAB) family NADH-FMN oxidoreductase RutF